MFKKFSEHINAQKYFENKNKILLALSGGMDSMVLAHLMMLTEYEFSVAHFDHLTRNGQSTEDASFVESFCAKHNITFHLGRMDKSGKQANFQAEARKQRYAFFKQIDYDCLLTAHHKDDQAETISLNFFRGKSLNPIEEEYNNIARPLLPFSKEEIESYAISQKIEFRTDESNNENKYLRNHFRNEIHPRIKQVIPNYDDRVISLSREMRKQSMFIESLVERIIPVDQTGNVSKILINKIRDFHALESQLIYYLLRPYGFNDNQAMDIFSCLDKPGSLFKSERFELLVDRHEIKLRKIPAANHSSELIVSLKNLPTTIEFSDYHFSFSKEKGFEETNNRNIFQCPVEVLDAKIVLRYWKDGDRFQPFGMMGQTKSLKKFFVDEQLSLFEKSQLPILCHEDGRIMWICGLRSDERFKVVDKNKSCLKIIMRKS